MFTAKKTAEKYQKTGNYPVSFIKCLLSIILKGSYETCVGKVYTKWNLE